MSFFSSVTQLEGEECVQKSGSLASKMMVTKHQTCQRNQECGREKVRDLMGNKVKMMRNHEMTHERGCFATEGEDYHQSCWITRQENSKGSSKEAP